MIRLFAIFLLVSQCHRPAIGQVSSTSAECGQLNEEYLNNEKNITNFDEFPWMARIAYRNAEDEETSYRCLGVLISKRYVISVAHCFMQESHAAYAVALGDWNAANNIKEVDCSTDGQCAPVPKQYDIEKIIPHASYKSRVVDNDIALLRLASEVDFSDYIQPICLPTSLADENSQQMVANNYHLTGFARKIFNEDVGLHKFKTPLHTITLERCRDIFKSVVARPLNISDNNVCANCQVTNDLLSGSPLMEVRSENLKAKRVYLIGISSRGTRYCGPTEPMIFTRIPSYLDWIKNNLQE